MTAVPAASSEAARRRMVTQRQRDTRPEMELRRRLHAQGLRYRVDIAPLNSSRRRADIVFPSARVAVFVDGCFWHGCPVHGTSPKQNARWWRDKLAANVQRDRSTDDRLRETGWTVVRVWEHEDPTTAAAVVSAAVSSGLALVANAGADRGR
jgi:DNA mismatch endonuclease (patch repair protein)